MEDSTREKKNLHFLEQIVEKELAEGKNDGAIQLRFPPEPNGYLHIGHAKSICLNFGLAQQYGGQCNLRFDDTNPEKEDTEYVDSIQADIKWLGFDWSGEPKYASDYFEDLYAMAQQLIRDGKAYVDELSPSEIQEYRGTVKQAGKESPWRNRSAHESLDLLERMRHGEFEEGKYLVRAKIDMAHPNMLMRDPILYRIRHAEHHRTGSEWKIYPMYDFAHGQSDYLEGITHSVCTLEFEVHRELYDWFLDQLADKSKIRPRQIEFARLNLNYTVMSKRRLLRLVQEGVVSGWDDPRMPTLSGMRRRGYTAAGIRNFADRIGVARRDNVIDLSLLEFSVREDLNKKAIRYMGVLDPLKVVITNYPDDKHETVTAINNPEDPEGGERELGFSKVIYIEREDFMEDAPKKFFRLAPGREVRLRYAYYITCTDVLKDADGNIVALHCTYDPETRGGQSPDGRKVKGTIHWVDAATARKAEVRLYDRLFSDPTPDGHKDQDFMEFLNPDSLQTIEALVEPAAVEDAGGNTFQFERKGYFCHDKDSSVDKPVFNRTVTLKDSWTKEQGK